MPIMYKCDICEKIFRLSSDVKEIRYGYYNIYLCKDCQRAVQVVIGTNASDYEWLVKFWKKEIEKRRI